MAGVSDAPTAGKEVADAPAPAPFPNSRLKPSGMLRMLPSTRKYFAENPHHTFQEDLAYYESLGLPPFIDLPFHFPTQLIRLPCYDTVARLIIELNDVPPNHPTRSEAIREEIYKLLEQACAMKATNVVAAPSPILHWLERDIDRCRALLATLGEEEAANLRKRIADLRKGILLYSGPEDDWMKD